MQRKQYTVFESFYKAIARMKRKSDQADTFMLMSRLALYGEEPDLDKVSEQVASALELIVPVIQSCNNKAANRKTNENKTEQIKTNQNKTEQIANDKDKERDKEKENDNKKEKRKKYGEYGHVLLTDAELEKLKARYPETWQKNIDILDKGIELHGYKYKNHYLAILKWSKDEPAKVTPITGTDEIKRLLEAM